MHPFYNLRNDHKSDSDSSAVIRMEGAMATMSHSDFKCPIGKGSVETMSHYFLET